MDPVVGSYGWYKQRKKIGPDTYTNLSFDFLHALLNNFCSSFLAAVSLLNGCSGLWKRNLVQHLLSR